MLYAWKPPASQRDARASDTLALISDSQHVRVTMLFEAQLVDSVCVKQLPEEKGGSYLRLMVVRALSL